MPESDEIMLGLGGLGCFAALMKLNATMREQSHVPNLETLRHILRLALVVLVSSPSLSFGAVQHEPDESISPVVQPEFRCAFTPSTSYADNQSSLLQTRSSRTSMPMSCAR